MTELSRTLLAAAREGLAPDAAVAARVRAKVAAAVSGASATGTATSIAAPKSGSSSLLLKLGAALLAVGVAATTIIVRRSDRMPEAPRVSVMVPDADEVRTHERVVAANDPLAASEPQRTHAKQVTTRVEAAAAPRDVEAATLSREVELLDLAMASLRKHAPNVALEAIRVFERETFGHGQMAEEAAAIEIEARCALREDVTAAVERFDQRWPNSAQRDRISATCAGNR